MLTKSAPVTAIKAGTQDGLEEGQFEALVAVMGNRDSVGDVVMPGAFDKSLAEWKASGNPLPIIWSHEYFDPDNHIGVALDVEERTVGGKTGLWVKGQLDTGEEDRRARKVSSLLRGKRVTQFSFSYDIVDGAPAKSEELGEFYQLNELKLYEVGPTLIGANQQTELLNAKALGAMLAEVKAGRVLSAKNEAKLRDAYDAIGAVLSTLESDDGKAKAGTSANDEEPDSDRAKSQEPGALTPAMRSALLEIEIAGL